MDRDTYTKYNYKGKNIDVCYTRRGYGKGVVFTWVYVKNKNGKYVLLGDPFQSVKPKRELMNWLIDRKIESQELVL